MHVFKYSQRKGTRAAKMQGQVDGKIKEERSRKLIELSNKNEKEYNEKYAGKKVEILFEEEKKGIYKGHTKNYILGYLKINKDGKKDNEEELKNKLDKKILEVTCIKAEEDHILVEI